MRKNGQRNEEFGQQIGRFDNLLRVKMSVKQRFNPLEFFISKKM